LKQTKVAAARREEDAARKAALCEVDLLLENDDTIIAVEVKARPANKAFFNPAPCVRKTWHVLSRKSKNFRHSDFFPVFLLTLTRKSCHYYKWCVLVKRNVVEYARGG